MLALGRGLWTWATLVLLFVAEGFTSNLDNWRTWKHMQIIFLKEKPVSEFAYKDLCGTRYGKDLFFDKLKSQLCGLRDSFIDTFIADLCFQRNRMLIDWVSELFDADGNSFISYFEERP